MRRRSERASSPTRVGLARPSTSLAPRIVILGGGFAGVNTALELAKRSAGVRPIRVTLLSERNFFLFTPMGAHHEHYDGKGYPQGLPGEGIPLTARIFCVVDALDAMTHDRPYRRARSLSEALEVLRREAGMQFDPRVVEAVLALPMERWRELLGLSEEQPSA